jgi:hypothetical protein
MTPPDARNSRLLGNLADLADLVWPTRAEVRDVLAELERLAAREREPMTDSSDENE